MHYFYCDSKILATQSVLYGDKVPEVGKFFECHCDYSDESYRVIIKKINETRTQHSTIFEYDVVKPEKIEVILGCGHKLFVPNESLWILADDDASTKCEDCWRKIGVEYYGHGLGAVESSPICAKYFNIAAKRFNDSFFFKFYAEQNSFRWLDYRDRNIATVFEESDGLKVIKALKILAGVDNLIMVEVSC